MNNQCKCESKKAEVCCPSDENLRKEWLLNLEKDHKPVRNASKEIVRKLKLLSNSHRIEILLMLEQREHCMDEIAKKLMAEKSAVSYHLGAINKTRYDMQNKTLSVCILFTFSRREEKDFDFSKTIVQNFLKFFVGFNQLYARIMC